MASWKTIAYEPRWRAGSERMQSAVAALLADVSRYEKDAGLRSRIRRPADAESFALEVERLLCNVGSLALVGLQDAALAIGRHPSLSVGGSKTRTRLLDTCAAAGLLTQAQAGTVRADGIREATRWRASPAVVRYLPPDLRLADLALAREDQQLVVLRDVHDKSFLTLPQEAAILEAEMRAVNAWLATLPISIHGYGAEAWLSEPNDNRWLPAVMTAQHVELVRTFRGSLAEGGRMYGSGFWITAPSAWRFQHIRLAGERVAEVDYKEINLRLAYHHHGLRWPFPPGADAYTAGDGQREGWKKITNAMLRAKAPLRRWPGKDNDQRSTHRAFFPQGTKFPGVAASVRRRHAALDAAGAFGAGLGSAFERTESDLAVALLLACRDRQLPALPVHDCLLVPASRADEAAELMQAMSIKVAGVQLPISVEHGELELRDHDGGRGVV